MEKIYAYKAMFINNVITGATSLNNSYYQTKQFRSVVELLPVAVGAKVR